MGLTIAILAIFGNLGHRTYAALREALDHAQIALPVDGHEWRREQFVGWSEDRRFALRNLSELADQLRAITVAMVDDGNSIASATSVTSGAPAPMRSTTSATAVSASRPSSCATATATKARPTGVRPTCDA